MARLHAVGTIWAQYCGVNPVETIFDWHTRVRKLICEQVRVPHDQLRFRHLGKILGQYICHEIAGRCSCLAKVDLDEFLFPGTKSDLGSDITYSNKLHSFSRSSNDSLSS